MNLFHHTTLKAREKAIQAYANRHHGNCKEREAEVKRTTTELLRMEIEGDRRDSR